jgi:hypothetical protein
MEGFDATSKRVINKEGYSNKEKKSLLTKIELVRDISYHKRSQISKGLITGSTNNSLGEFSKQSQQYRSYPINNGSILQRRCKHNITNLENKKTTWLHEPVMSC